MIKYRDLDNLEPQRFHCDPGSSEKELFVMDNGILINAGFEDSQALINSYRDSTDLNKLLERISETELSELLSRRGAYIDTTIFPTNLVEAKNMLRDSMLLYDQLSDDIKKEVGSYDEFSKWTDDDYYAFIERHRVVTQDSNDVPKEVVDNEL